MNIWVEYYKDRNNIHKRFFDYMKDAKIFAKRMADEYLELFEGILKESVNA